MKKSTKAEAKAFKERQRRHEERRLYDQILHQEYFKNHFSLSQGGKRPYKNDILKVVVVSSVYMCACVDRLKLG